MVLVADGGLGALTHRAVERAAGVPHGSVTYHLGTTEDLIGALVERMAATCQEQVAVIARDITLALAPRGRELDPAAVATALLRWMDDGKALHLARFELELAAARDPRLREHMSRAALVFWRLCEPVVLAMGSDRPELHGRSMAAMVDGLLLDHLAHDPVGPEVVEAGVVHLLRSWAATDGSPA
jgi:AcrR family transcriptional regulator